MEITSTHFEQAKYIATKWQVQIQNSREKSEEHFHEIMKRLLNNPPNKVFLIELLDQSFRASSAKRVAEQLEFLFDKHSDTDFFTNFEALLIALFRNIGIYLPSISIPLFINYLRNDVSAIVLKGEESLLNKHLKKRRDEGTRVNINIIGEAVLGEAEAQNRVYKYISALENPNIDYVSIKISTIFSQINPLAHEWSVEKITRRLEIVYDAAIKNSFTNSKGVREAKFINLDMEEYKDVQLTINSFITALSKENYHSLYAGIVIQAYLPESIAYVKKLVSWAQIRVKNGGAPIKIRLVKGANQEMELTEASIRNWECVTYLQKSQTDANYKYLLNYLLDPSIAHAVHVGVASHNLFEHALGITLARERGVTDSYTAEMLEGMSETAYKLLKNDGQQVILYAPIATAETFTNAIAYLVRRFDENTAKQNFLRHSFGLKVGSKAWDTLMKSHEDAIEELKNLKQTPNRTQDRTLTPTLHTVDFENYIFTNESDTDFTLEQNRKWAETIKDKWKNISDTGGYIAYPVVGANKKTDGEKINIIDKSQFHQNKVVGYYIKATAQDIRKAVDVAKSDPDGWRKKDIKERHKILANAAHEFRKKRGDLIGIAAAEVGKVFTETDGEISEAIDFLNFYPYSVSELQNKAHITAEAKGVGVVISPWNFPIAIPAGGIAASLSSGNSVIIKPSSDAVLCAYMLCQCFWDAGVSKNTLQFVPADGQLAAEELIANRDIDFVIFTGSEQTAYGMIKTRPDIHLIAETGGKDATIVTALADKDQAVKNVVASAFNNSGQKCSATSLLVLEKEVYEDRNFQEMLIDAAKSLEVGSVWDFKNKIGTLVRRPSGNLEKSLKFLDNTEEWIIKPTYAENNPYILNPSIRWGTKKGDFCHMKELFGPVLSVMRAENLDDAIDIVNSTGYGLTSGVETLDEREKIIWKQKLKAGNLYINRVTTGAIVLRQPFGGMGKSAVGSGKKAGGLNYVSQLMNIKHTINPEHEQAEHHLIEKLISLNEYLNKETLNEITDILKNFAYWLDNEFLQEHDYFNLRGESNTIKYIKVKNVLLRFEESDSLIDMVASALAVLMVGSKLHISLPETGDEKFILVQKILSPLLNEYDSISQDNRNELLSFMQNFKVIRYLNHSSVEYDIYKSLADKALQISSEEFIPNGRVELLHYFIEQSISDSYHRYGNLGMKALNF